MLIIGAKGFAKEVLEIFHQQNNLQNIAFYDDVNTDVGDVLYNKFPILKSENEVTTFFKTTCTKFTIGIGNPVLRHNMYNKFQVLGGEFVSGISPFCTLGSYDVNIGVGAIIMNGAILSNSTKIGKGCIVYYNSIITHDCLIGNFVEISPNVTLLGHVKVGSFSHIGANVTILPKVTIGKNAVIGAGSVVTKDIPDNSVAFGTPAKVVKQLAPLNF